MVSLKSPKNCLVIVSPCYICIIIFSCRASETEPQSQPPQHQILHRQQTSGCRDCWRCRRSGYPILRQPDLQPLHQGRQQEQQQGDQQQDLWWPDYSKRSLGLCCWFCWSCFAQQCSRKSLWTINEMYVLMFRLWLQNKRLE